MIRKRWRDEAWERFPEVALRQRFLGIDSPYTLWSLLKDAFEDAYKHPRDEDLIRRIYDFCDWCLSQPAGRTAEDDPATCIAVCFLEHIPEIPEALEDMPRWFTRSEVVTMREIFSYHVGSEGYYKILERFDREF